MSNTETIHPLDEESLRHFAQKGLQDDRCLAQTGAGNAVKVRRVVQLVKDLARRPISELRVLDLACGEGVYSIEIGLRGAEVLGVDARTERMQIGVECARKNGLANVAFRQGDVRKISKATDGEFDVILFLGILYHLDVPDSFHVLTNLYDMCRGMLIIDTHVSLAAQDSASFENRSYVGRRGREHCDADTQAQRQKHLLQSIDNPRNFWFTHKSLTRLLCDVGFTSVLECFAPLEAHKPTNRVTLVAIKGAPVRISSYPWLNELSEDQIGERLRPAAQRAARRSAKLLLRDAANVALRPFGLELQRRSV
jgi:SAM-dependent methyltransferase